MCGKHWNFSNDSLDLGRFFHLSSPLADIHLHGTKGVDGEPLVRVDGDAEEAGVGVDQLGLVPHHRVPEDAGVAEEGEVGHVLRHVELWRVDLADRVGLIGLHLSWEHVNCKPQVEVESLTSPLTLTLTFLPTASQSATWVVISL